MKPIVFAALAVASLSVAGLALAQGTFVKREDAEALFAQIKPACANGPINKKACGVMVYTPEDCSKEKDPHTRIIYNAYEDGTVRFQAGTQVQRNRPGALLAGMGVFNRKGETTRYVNPVFLSWEAYQAGQKTMKICDKDARISVKDFEISSAVEKFLKANP
jgi:hypothetical protein